jgi:hypothetical protein
MKQRSTVAQAFTCLLASGVAASGGWVPFDISGAYNYDAVATTREIAANPGVDLVTALGDHNWARVATSSDNFAYIHQSGAGTGTGLPDDGNLGKYQLGPYDNGTDGLTNENNTIEFITNTLIAPATNKTPNSITTVITLPVSQQKKYTHLNMLFTSWTGVKSETKWESALSVTYDDATTEYLARNGDGSTAEYAPFGGATIAGQGGFAGTNDTSTFVNKAPNYPGTIAHTRVVAMTRAYEDAAVRTRDCSMWEFAGDLPCNSNKVIVSVKILVKAPSDNVNRDQALYVHAISGKEFINPGTRVLIQ